jgi:uncharacterized protein (DUF427 family)
MSRRVRTLITSGLGELRHEPLTRRIRATVGDDVVVDTTRAVLVWEPRRVVPQYAVPVTDVRADLRTGGAAAPAADDVGLSLPDVSARPVLDPSIPFAVHTGEGDGVDVVTPARTLVGAGFRSSDADLEGYVVLDFDAFDAWHEEDVLTVGHPHDPYHRIDALPSSRSVRLELDGVVLAESSRPVLLFESMLPMRFYLPRDDVRAELVPSPTRTTCAYKGHAGYWSAVVAGTPVPDLAWSYAEPLHDAAAVRGLVAFFDERVDVVLDGVRRERPVTPWSGPTPGGAGASPH